MTKDRLIIIIGLIGLLTGLTCCSDDDDDRRPTPVTVRLSAYAAPYTDVEPTSRETRTWYPTGYMPYGELSNTGDLMKSNVRTPIGLYFTQDGSDPLVRRFRPTAGENPDWLMEDSVAAGSYYIYGYVPYSGAEVANSVIEPFNNSYANGAVLTLRGINTVLSEDVCVVVGATHGTKTGDDPAVPIPNPLPAGHFNSDFKAEGNYLFLLFDHLYAAMRFRFRVGDEYAKLRTIKVRKLELSAYQDEACTIPMKKVKTTVTLRANETGASPIVGDIEFTPDGNEDADTAVICDRDTDPVLLPTGDNWSDCLGFAPKMATYFVLSTTYDVYDNNRTTEHPDGNLIRQGCVADNRLNLRSLFNSVNIRRGYMYTIKLTVEPTYLYMLSEPDLDNPTITVDG